MLDLDPDKNHLRIRAKEKDSDDNENDGSNSNHADIRLKVQYIVRLEVGRDKSSQEGGSESPKPVKCFSVIMQTITEKSSFNFEADSLGERDVIVSSIRGLIEQLKHPSESRRRKSQSPIVDDGRKKERVSQRTQIHDGSPSHLRSEVIQTPRAPGEEGLETSIVYFDFEVSEEGKDPAIETGIQWPGKANQNSEDRNDSSEPSLDNVEERISTESSSDVLSKMPNQMNSLRSETKIEDLNNKSPSEKETDEAKELAITVIEGGGMRDLGIEVTGNDWSVDDILCGLRSGSDKWRRQRVSTEDEQVDKEKPGEKEWAIEEMKESLIYESLGCHALGCQSQALAAVEDGELAAMANHQVAAGPWCTDDICTASLKDFADTMKEIFEIKQKSREGKKPHNEKQRAMAEEYITGVLGAPSTMASLLSVKDIWNTAVAKRSDRKKTRFQNRASVPDAQAIRLNRLRNQMTFKAADHNEKMPFMQIITSFDDIERTGRRSNKLNPEAIAGPAESSAFLHNVVGNMGTQETSDSNGDEVLYYDSDPEDARERTLKRGPRRALAERENTLEGAKPVRRSTLSGIPMNRLGLNRRWKKMDDDVITDIIEVSWTKIFFCQFLQIWITV
jgi:hypothetical protein